MSDSRHLIFRTPSRATGVFTMPSPTAIRPLVFNVGNDAALLSYRGDVLRLAGFQVMSVSPGESGQQEQITHLCRMHHPDISLACHTLKREERIGLALQLRTVCPEIKLLAMTTGDLDREEEALYDALIDSLDGPLALIDKLRQQLP